MLQNRMFALRDLEKTQCPDIKVRFKTGADQTPVAEVEQDFPITICGKPASGILTGSYLMGRVAGNVHDHREMQKDWNVMRSNASAFEVTLDPWPPMGQHISVLVEGRSRPLEGVLATHLRDMGNGREIKNVVFLSLVRQNDHEMKPGLTLKASARLPGTDKRIEAEFEPMDMNSVIAWSYVTAEGQHLGGFPNPPTEFFVDCEFEDSTKTLISVGLTTRSGASFYAFDSDAADAVREQWVIDNVLPVLLETPPGCHVYDLARFRKEGKPVTTFQQFIIDVLDIVRKSRSEGLGDKVVIRSDFPTDVGYIAPLFHLGNGERIKPMQQLEFAVDYVDSYPSSLKAPKQHNAAWDAFAMWLHMGYVAYMDPRRITQSKVWPTAEELESGRRDYINAWTSGPHDKPLVPTLDPQNWALNFGNMDPAKLKLPEVPPVVQSKNDARAQMQARLDKASKARK